MIYEEIKKFSKQEVEKAISKDDPKELLYAVLSVTLYSENADYAEKICVQLSNHKHFNVRGNAILGFSHIARIHEKLNENIVKPIVENALKDDNEYVRVQAEGAKEDLEHYLGWKFINNEKI